MAVQAVTLHLPSPLYEQSKRRAEQTQRSVEAEALAGLVRHFERAMLVRVQAAALLRERGYDVAEILAEG